jgi:hypothetical protein
MRHRTIVMGSGPPYSIPLDSAHPRLRPMNMDASAIATKSKWRKWPTTTIRPLLKSDAIA